MRDMAQLSGMAGEKPQEEIADLQSESGREAESA